VDGVKDELRVTVTFRNPVFVANVYLEDVVNVKQNTGAQDDSTVKPKPSDKTAPVIFVRFYYFDVGPIAKHGTFSDRSQHITKKLYNSVVLSEIILVIKMYDYVVCHKMYHF
jgi:hypothetical protein